MFTRLKSYVEAKSTQASQVLSDMSMKYSLTRTTTANKLKPDSQSQVTQKSITVQSQNRLINASNGNILQDSDKCQTIVPNNYETKVTKPLTSLPNFIPVSNIMSSNSNVQSIPIVNVAICQTASVDQSVPCLNSIPSTHSNDGLTCNDVSDPLSPIAPSILSILPQPTTHSSPTLSSYNASLNTNPIVDTCSTVWTSLAPNTHTVYTQPSCVPLMSLKIKPPPHYTLSEALGVSASSDFSNVRSGQLDPKLVCIFCCTTDHGSHICQRFDASDNFWAQIYKDRRCKNCLRQHHRADSCFDPSFCTVHGCSRSDKHSPVLCRQRYLGSYKRPKLPMQNISFLKNHHSSQFSRFPHNQYSQKYSGKLNSPQSNYSKISAPKEYFSQGTQTDTHTASTQTENKSVSTQTVLSWYSHTEMPCTSEDVALHYAPEYAITSFKTYTMNEWNEPSGKTDLAQLPTRDQHKSTTTMRF